MSASRRPVVRLGMLILGIILPLCSGAFEMGEGLLRLVVNDLTGRTAFYRVVDPQTGRIEPLLYDQDSRTSFPTLALDSRYFRLGDVPEFRYSLRRIASGVLIQYRSSTFTVNQSIVLRPASGSGPADSFLITFELENRGTKEVRVGLRMLLDTWLGEASGVHLRSASGEAITEELRLGIDAADESLTSPGSGASLTILLKAEGLVPPSQVVVANWQRLADAAWAFESSGLRGFSFAPYSINDSALALYWFPENLAPGAKRRMSFSLLSDPGTESTAVTARFVAKDPVTVRPLESETSATTPGLEALPAADSETASTTTTAQSDAPASGTISNPASGETAAATPSADTSGVVPAVDPRLASSGAAAASVSLDRSQIEAVITELLSLLRSLNAALDGEVIVTPMQYQTWKERLASLRRLLEASPQQTQPRVSQ